MVLQTNKIENNLVLLKIKLDLPYSIPLTHPHKKKTLQYSICEHITHMKIYLSAINFRNNPSQNNKLIEIQFYLHEEISTANALAVLLLTTGFICREFMVPPCYADAACRQQNINIFCFIRHIFAFIFSFILNIIFL